MRLDRVQVTNFRSIDDSTGFKISDITCLVGKNQSGKTTVLQAIEPLNPQNAAHAEYDRTRDYPRQYLTDYTDRHKSKAARVVQSVWSLTESEVAKVRLRSVRAASSSAQLRSKSATSPKRSEAIASTNQRFLSISPRKRTAPRKRLPLWPNSRRSKPFTITSRSWATAFLRISSDCSSTLPTYQIRASSWRLGTWSIFRRSCIFQTTIA